jgi:hypothetical protein
MQKPRCKTDFSLKANKFTTDPWRSPPSFLHLIIVIEIGLWHTSNLGMQKMKVGSGKEPHPSRVLYIGPNKRLNDYYAPRA